MKCFIAPSAVFLYRPAVDFRKSINGLTLIVEQELGLDPYNSALYLFANKARDKAKILYWDRTGFALWYKRLEKARFKTYNVSGAIRPLQYSARQRSDLSTRKLK